MGAITKIAWCDHTFNPWWGCMQVSPLCDHCYAMMLDIRWFKGAHWGPAAPRRYFGDTH
jgi:protein gp37